jgi:hypothetical protein
LSPCARVRRPVPGPSSPLISLSCCRFIFHRSSTDPRAPPAPHGGVVDQAAAGREPAGTRLLVVLALRASDDAHCRSAAGAGQPLDLSGALAHCLSHCVRILAISSTTPSLKLCQQDFVTLKGRRSNCQGGWGCRPPPAELDAHREQISAQTYLVIDSGVPPARLMPASCHPTVLLLFNLNTTALP